MLNVGKLSDSTIVLTMIIVFVAMMWIGTKVL
jgi:hypothetical protein